MANPFAAPSSTAVTSICHICDSTTFPHDYFMCNYAHLRRENPAAVSRANSPPSEFHIIASFRNKVIEDIWINLGSSHYDQPTSGTEASGSGAAASATHGATPQNAARGRKPKDDHSTIQVAVMDHDGMICDLWIRSSTLTPNRDFTDDELGEVLEEMMGETHLLKRTPAAPATIAKLPKVRVDQSMMGADGKVECSICLDKLELGSSVSMLPCSHFFHVDCVAYWLNMHDSCPYCRQPLAKATDRRR